MASPEFSRETLPSRVAGSPRASRSPKGSVSSSPPDLFGKPSGDTPLSPDSKQLSGVDGDIKEAFGERKEEPEDEDEAIGSLHKNDTHEVDLEALELQVNQMRESLRASETQTPNQVNLTNGHADAKQGFKRPLFRGDSDRTDTDTDDEELHMRVGERNYSSRTQMTDDESYIQTDDDESNLRTDDEDIEWRETMQRWANR
ncbi:hypothetical protein QZH41_003687 [Actinostola sp. cb2023]|nr:hypothetical protein QZH41_003687 [Actinostola sp. cb2023]